MVAPDRTSLRPLKPLCSFAFGAGSPLRKCSSSASVPLSLAGVDSLEKAGYPVGDSSALPLSAAGLSLWSTKRSEGCGSSALWWWYGCGVRFRARRLSCSSGLGAVTDSGAR